MSSPADAKTRGSVGCHATALTQPLGWASRASTRRPLIRHMYIRESGLKSVYANLYIVLGPTLATADNKVLIRSAKRRPNYVLCLQLSSVLLHHLSSVNLHELDLVLIHADQHML